MSLKTLLIQQCTTNYSLKLFTEATDELPMFELIRRHDMCSGVSQLLVAVNKMDTVDWSKDRYDEIVQKLRVFLRQAGFKDCDVSFVPCSGLAGDNLTHSPQPGHCLTMWYSGLTLAAQIGLFTVIVLQYS